MATNYVLVSCVPYYGVEKLEADFRTLSHFLRSENPDYSRLMKYDSEKRLKFGQVVSSSFSLRKIPRLSELNFSREVPNPFLVPLEDLQFFPIAVQEQLDYLAKIGPSIRDFPMVSLTVVYLRVVLCPGESLQGSKLDHRDGQAPECMCGTKIYYNVDNVSLASGMTLVVPEIEPKQEFSLGHLNKKCVTLPFPHNLVHNWTAASHLYKATGSPDKYTRFFDLPQNAVVKDLVVTCASDCSVIEH